MTILDNLASKNARKITEAGIYEDHYKNARETLDNSQRVLLLRLVDEKNAAIEIASKESYKNGFRDAMKLSIEIFYKEEQNQIDQSD